MRTYKEIRADNNYEAWIQRIENSLQADTETRLSDLQRRVQIRFTGAELMAILSSMERAGKVSIERRKSGERGRPATFIKWTADRLSYDVITTT